jgi:hypothetical protein
MKTVQEYMNDPRMLNDPDMAKALEPVKEIHAARLMLQDETAGMSAAEEVAYINKQARDAMAARGMKVQFVNLAGQGKLGPRPMEAVGK